MIKKLKKDDIWALIVGASALATGGGAAPSYEQFCKNTDPVLDQGFEAKLIDPNDLKDDDLARAHME